MTQGILVSGVSGGVAGIVVDFVYYPIETIKTQIQASIKGQKNYRKQKYFQYKGFSAQFTSAFPFAFTFFFVYEYSKSLLNRIQVVGTQNHAISASLAEFSACLLRNPFEVVKQQQQVGLDHYVRHTIQNVYKLNGIRGFYVGYFSSIFRDIPFSLLQLTIYESINQRFREKNKKKNLSYTESAISGGIGAFFASSLTTPLDVIKTRLMVQRENIKRGIKNVAREIYAIDGFKGFFKGVQYRAIPFTFTGSIYFTTYEQTKQIINNQINQSY